MGNLSIENDRAIFTDLCTTQVYTDRGWHQVVTNDAIYTDRGWVSITCGPRPASYKGINETCVKGQNTDVTPFLGPIYSLIYGINILVVNYTGNSVGVLNTTTNTVTSTYNLGAAFSNSKPRNIVNVSVSGIGNQHIVFYENGTMLPLNADTGATGTPQLPLNATVATNTGCYTIGGYYINDVNINYLIIPNYFNFSIDLYNPSTLVFIKSILLPTSGAKPTFIQYNPSNQKIYIGTFNTNQIFVYTTAQIALSVSGTAQQPVTISALPQPGITYTTTTPIGNFALNGNTLYAISTAGQRIFIINSLTDQITTTYNSTAPIDRILYANNSLYATQVTATILTLDPNTLALKGNTQLSGFQRIFYPIWNASNTSLYITDLGTPVTTPAYSGSRVSVISTGKNTGAGFFLQQALYYTDGAREVVPSTDASYAGTALVVDNTPGLVTPPYIAPSSPSQTITCTIGM